MYMGLAACTRVQSGVVVYKGGYIKKSPPNRLSLRYGIGLAIARLIPMRLASTLHY